MGIDLELSPFLDDQGFAVTRRPGHVVGKGFAVARGFARRVADLARLARFDAIFVHRESTPFGPTFIEQFSRRSGIPLVYDFDDPIFIRHVHPSNRAWAWLRNPGRVATVSRLATSVIVQNEYLAEHARRWNRAVSIIPTPVDTQKHRPRRERQPGPIVIGWLGSELTAPYIHVVDDVLGEVSAHRDVIVRIVGGTYENESIRRLELRNFSLDREQDDLESFDIGILPEPDDEWTRGKGGYKALLYMAVGIPVVASRVGVNPEIVQEEKTGFCVNTRVDWVRALCRLIDDDGLRERLGAAGRARVIEQYSVDVMAPRLAKVLRAAVSGAPHGN